MLRTDWRESVSRAARNGRFASGDDLVRKTPQFYEARSAG
jgi:hypothetical protein